MRFLDPAPLLGLLAAWACGASALERAPPDGYRSIPLRTHSLSSPYLDSDMQSRWFDFGGDTIVRADQYIRLASDLPSRSGYLFSKIPLTATNWEIEFEFKIDGKGSLHADGMALWVTKQRAQQGDVFGHVNNFEGLGIFFDTYKNNRPGTVFPYVMAVVGDGNTAYNKNDDGKDQELAGCSARGIRSASVATKARLTYFQDTSLKLELQYKSEDEWTLCFETGAIKLPSVTYLGFSAETGELSDNFDIISVETKNLYASVQPNANSPGSSGRGGGTMNKKGREAARRKSQAKGGWGWFFVKMLLFVGVCGGGYVGYTMYRAQKRHSRFD